MSGPTHSRSGCWYFVSSAPTHTAAAAIRDRWSVPARTQSVALPVRTNGSRTTYSFPACARNAVAKCLNRFGARLVRLRRSSIVARSVRLDGCWSACSNSTSTSNTSNSPCRTSRLRSAMRSPSLSKSGRSGTKRRATDAGTNGISNAGRTKRAGKPDGRAACDAASGIVKV